MTVLLTISIKNKTENYYFFTHRTKTLHGNYKKRIDYKVLLRKRIEILTSITEAVLSSERLCNSLLTTLTFEQTAYPA